MGTLKSRGGDETCVTPQAHRRDKIDWQVVRRRLFRQVNRRCKPQDQEDLVQDILFRTYRGLDGLATQQDAERLALHVGAKALVDYYRRQGKDVPLTKDLPTLEQRLPIRATHPDDQVVGRASMKKLRAWNESVGAGLTQQQLRVIAILLDGVRETPRIARRLGVGVRAVQLMRNRIRVRLESALSKNPRDSVRKEGLANR